MNNNVDFKSRLLGLEDKFEKIRSKIERFYWIFLLIYFIPPMIMIFFLDKYIIKSGNFIIKIIIITVMAAGLFFHFFIRNKYFRGKKRFKNFIEKNLELLKKDFAGEDAFKLKVIEEAKNIFSSRGIELSNVTINQSMFWHLIFYYLEIELTD